MSKIEWTGETWNPTTGCDRISPGCRDCYAATLAARLKLMGQAKYQNDGDPVTSGPGFALTVHPDTLDVPLRWRKPRTIFVNSMSDLFHKDVPSDFVDAVLETMLRCPQHTFQVLTKRPQRMAREITRFYDDWCWPESGCPIATVPQPNWWMGASIESNSYVWRANHVRRTPAAVRFLSCEPLLGPLPSLDLTDIDWVICGAESGSADARTMDMGWVRELRDKCTEADVAFFLKQDARNGRKIPTPELDGQTWVQFPAVRS